MLDAPTSTKHQLKDHHMLFPCAEPEECLRCNQTLEKEIGRIHLSYNNAAQRGKKIIFCCVKCTSVLLSLRHLKKVPP